MYDLINLHHLILCTNYTSTGGNEKSYSIFFFFQNNNLLRMYLTQKHTIIIF